MNHPAYKQDSVVTEEINYDLVKAVDEMCVKYIDIRLDLMLILLLVREESDKHLSC